MRPPTSSAPLQAPAEVTRVGGEEGAYKPDDQAKQDRRERASRLGSSTAACRRTLCLAPAGVSHSQDSSEKGEANGSMHQRRERKEKGKGTREGECGR